MADFDPIRREELRIMGYSEVMRSTDLRMAKELAVDGPVDTSHGRKSAQAGDFLMEFPGGETDLVTAEDFAHTGYVVLPPEPTGVDSSPVELAQPVGLLQRDESATDEEAAADAG